MIEPESPDTLSHAEVELLLGSPLVDALRLKPKTRDGRELAETISTLTNLGLANPEAIIMLSRRLLRNPESTITPEAPDAV